MPISSHLETIEQIIRLQRHCDEFVLFVTTRAERHDDPTWIQLSSEFLNELASRIDENIEGNPEFKTSYERVFGAIDGARLRDERYDVFIPVGICKLVAGILAEHNFELAETAARVIVRDETAPERWLLHLALHVKAAIPPKAANLRSLGRTRKFYFERTIAPFVEYVGNERVGWLKESTDKARLTAKYGEYVTELAGRTLDLPIPEPTDRSD